MTNSIYFKILNYIHKTPDHLEKLGESLLYNFHRKHNLLKLKIKSYWEKLVLKTLQLEFNILMGPPCKCRYNSEKYFSGPYLLLYH